MSVPLSERMRPKNISEYFGQKHLVSSGKPIFEMIKNGFIPSFILWGPPGIGKTTLAYLISKELKIPINILSATSSGVKDIREIIDNSAKSGSIFRNILFIDEIHRFSKSQQDSLLNSIEKGVITLIGATTENPSFEINFALLSRCQIYTLNELSKDELLEILQNAIKKDEFLKTKEIILKETEYLLFYSGGDARKLLNIFELIVLSIDSNKIEITNELVKKNISENIIKYDKVGEYHYDIVSAFIKSIRGSDPNGAVYWLSRMIEGGENLEFIARRMVILASEDIGNANPTALVLATNTFSSVKMIGYPESRIILSQCAIYLACSPKSNASYLAIKKAQNITRETGSLPVPINLRNAPTKLMKELDYGKEYKYSHDYENNFIEQEFLPEQISGTKFFEPQNNQRELDMRNYLKKIWKDKYEY